MDVGCSSLVKKIHVIITVELILNLKYNDTGVSFCVFYVESVYFIWCLFTFERKKKVVERPLSRKQAGSDFEGSGCTNG